MVRKSCIILDFRYPPGNGSHLHAGKIFSSKFSLLLLERYFNSRAGCRAEGLILQCAAVIHLSLVAEYTASDNFIPLNP